MRESSFLNNYFKKFTFPTFKYLLVLITVIRTVTASANNADPLSPTNSRIFEYHFEEHPPPLKLKKCEGFRPSSDTIELPTYSVLEGVYYTANFTLDSTLYVCPTGSTPGKSGVKAISIADYNDAIAKFESAEEQSQEEYRLLRNDVFLLDTGNLSVGQNDVAWYYSAEEFCIEEIRGTKEATVMEFRTCEFDQSRPIFPKCCLLGTTMNEDYTSCSVPSKKDANIQYLNAKSLKKMPLKKANPVFTSPKIDCVNREHWERDECNFVFYPVTDDRIAFVGAHRTWEFLQSNMTKCLDPIYKEDGTEQYVLILCIDNSTSLGDKDSQARISFIYMIMMYIGAGFHFLTTLVYLITWTRQNIHGKTLCSCTGSLFFMQIFLGTAHLLGLGGFGNRKNTFCFINSIGGQYFMIAAFTWLLVVNIDLWRTFRSMRTDGSKSLKRFLAYSALGWGFPLMVSIISITLESVFKCRKSGIPVPEFGEHYCFVSPWAQGYYVYYILSFLITLSCIFAVLTTFGLYSFKKDTSNLRSSKRAADKQNVLLFLKLGVVMGLTWVFEVISWAVTKEENENPIIWIILDLYNALSAILIFIIFVCKRTTLNLLEQTVPALKGISVAFSKFTSTLTGESSFGDQTVSTGAGSSAHNSTAEKCPKKSIPLKTISKEDGSTNANTNAQ